MSVSAIEFWLRVMKDTHVKELQNLPPQSRRATGARHVEVKCELHGRPQDVRGARAKAYLPRRASYKKWNPPEKERSVLEAAKPKGEGHLSPLTSDMELQDLEVCPAVFWPSFGAVFLHYAVIPQFWNDQDVSSQLLFLPAICYLKNFCTLILSLSADTVIQIKPN